MKLILIVIVFVGGVSFGGWKVYSYFEEKREFGRQAVIKRDQEKEKKKAVEDALAQAGVSPGSHPPAAAAHLPGSAAPLGVAAPDMSPLASASVDVVTSVGSYRFMNRLVPPAPAFLRDAAKGAMTVQEEIGANSWVWIGSSVVGSQILDLAKSYDRPQVEMDLDFVLVLVNSEKLRAFGLDVFYSESASWLTALSLQGDTGSLRISANGFAVDITASRDITGLSVLSQPVIRCLDGQPWKFSSDSEVPVPKSDVIDGVIRRSVEFRKIGFALEGSVSVVGDSLLLSVDQRNGSVAPATSQAAEVPVFNVQTLKTTVSMAFSEWSVLGGISVDREEKRNGLFRDSLKVSSDYLVIFARPRLALDAPPKAVPVDGSSSDSHPLLGEGVLPPRNWVDQEIELVEKKISRLQSLPSGK